MKRRLHKKTLDQSCAWLRDHWNPTNLDVPEELLRQWIYESAEEGPAPEGFHLSVFTFGLIQYDLIANQVPEGVTRSFSGETLLELFSRWQLKLALAEVHRQTGIHVKALPLFSFPDDEQVHVWCDEALGRSPSGATTTDCRKEP